MSSELLRLIATVCFVAAVIFFILAVFIWFYYKIPRVYLDLNSHNIKYVEIKSKAKPVIKTVKQKEPQKKIKVIETEVLNSNHRYETEEETMLLDNNLADGTTLLVDNNDIKSKLVIVDEIKITNGDEVI